MTGDVSGSTDPMLFPMAVSTLGRRFGGAARVSMAAPMALAAFLTGCSGQEPPAPTAAPATAPAALELVPYFRELRTVRVESRIGPLTLLLDTGGGATLITPEVAARAGCTPYGRDVGRRMSGERVEFGQCDALELSAGAWRAQVDPVAVFDVNALLPKELPRLDGVLALDAFRGRVITLDWPAGQLRIHGDLDADQQVRSTGLAVRAATGDSGRMFSAFAPIAATRGRLWFLLDSGNIRGTLVSRHVATGGLLTITPDGTAPLAIGGRAPVVMSVTVDDLDIDGALGTAFLMSGPVTLDLRSISSGG